MKIVQWLRMSHTGRTEEYTSGEEALWRRQRMRIIPTVVGQTLLSYALGAGIALGLMSLVDPTVIGRSAGGVLVPVGIFALLGISQALTRRKESFIRTHRLEQDLGDEYSRLPHADDITQPQG